MANQAASVEFQPLGVVGVIGPWNYPVFTPMGSIAYALAAGNAVVFKPSEYTPGVGKWLADSFAEAVPEHPVFQLITGFGETGAALCRAGVDKLAFTGSPATGKKIMAACAETLTPVLIEAGGKDALLVDEDADLDGGGRRGGVGRHVERRPDLRRRRAGVRAREGVRRLRGEGRRRSPSDVRAGADPEAQIGPITMPGQLKIIQRHIAGRARPAAAARWWAATDAVGDRFVQPTVLVDVPEDSEAVREETFGPTLTIAKVARHGRGDRQGQRLEVRPGVDGVLEAARHGTGRRGCGRA